MDEFGHEQRSTSKGVQVEKVLPGVELGAEDPRRGLIAPQPAE